MSAPVSGPAVALVAIARPTFDVPLAQSVADAAAAQMIAAGFQLAGPGSTLIMDPAGLQAAQTQLQSSEYDLLVLLQASFADSTFAVQLAALAHERRVPILLWAVPDARDGGRLRLNSLCGINLAGHALMLRGIKYDYVLAPAGGGDAADEAVDRQEGSRHAASVTYGSGDITGAAVGKIGVLARAGWALRRLRGATVGVIGQHPAGFDTCAYDVRDLARLFGVAVAPLDLHPLLQAARAAPDAARQPFLDRAAAAASNLSELDAAATRGTAGVYVALEQQVRERELAGVAVRCWPEFFTELGCAACGAMSALTEDGCPASCEADVNGTLTSLLLQTLSGGRAFITDLVSMDTESDTGVFWHCGLAPFDMADPQTPIAATVHSNRKLPLLFEFPLKPGRITLARLHRKGPAGEGPYELVIGGGEMLRADRPFGGTCGVVRFDQPAAVVLDRIMRSGLEHHFSITYGDVRAELAVVAQLAGIPVLELTARS